MVDGATLEMLCRATYRRFESCPLRQMGIIRTLMRSRGSYYSFLTIISVLDLKDEYLFYSESRAKNARLLLFKKLNIMLHFVVSKEKYFFNKMDIISELLLFRCGYHSTGKIGSKRKKLSLKTLKTQRVWLIIGQALFLFTQHFFLLVDFRVYDGKGTDYCFSRCYSAPAEKGK